MHNPIKTLTICTVALLLAGCSVQRNDRVELTDWQFEYNGQWYPATVPGFVHTDLMQNGLIDDPFYGTNEDSVQWVGWREWHYRVAIDRSALPVGDSLWVVFEGLAGDVVIEGLGTAADTLCSAEARYADNMFVSYRYFLPPEADTIHLFFLDLPYRDSVAESHYGIPLPDRRAFSRIAPYQQGWDWGPKLLTCGIWKEVYITNQRPSTQNTPSIQNSQKVELRQDPDSIGQSFTFYRDGKPVFIKGANWIPVHSFPVDNAENRARYRHLLCSAKEASFNMLRVWGGGIYEHDYFFDLCDSLGLMVWMDFNFSTMLYPDTEWDLNSIKEEAEQNIRRIARHPCVVLWCGNNEVKNGWEDWGWQGVYNWTPEQRARLQHAMDTLFGYTSTTGNTSNTSILAQAVKKCDPYKRPYITTSPLYGWGHPECVTHGDSHYWGVWWGEEPFEKYAEKTGRFMSEYGFQSYPMITTLKRVIPEDQLDIESPSMKNHQKHGRGREIIDKAMRQYYGFDSKTLSLEDYCYVSQLLQAWGTGYGIFQHIKQQPHCMGTLYWQLNDCWPVASWSSIDYYGNWKALHYRAQALFTETSGLERWQQYYSVYPKNRTYPEPKYKLSQAWQSDGSLVATLKAEVDLYDVYLDTDPHIDGHFTRNFVDLKAGESLRTVFVPVDSKADVRNVKIVVKTLNEIYRR
jgi:beta-mannosidase